MWTGGMEAFANGAEKNIGILGRFRVDDRRKRIKKYTFFFLKKRTSVNRLKHFV